MKLPHLRLWPTLVSAACVLLPGGLLANGGGYVGGTSRQGALGVFQPTNAEQIEMLTEDLRIDLHVEHGHIEVEYSLHNSGKAVTAEVGFPCVAISEGQAEGFEDKPKKGAKRQVTPPLRNFTAELDGKKLDWKTVEESAVDLKPFQSDYLGEGSVNMRPVPFWYTLKLPFEQGQTRTLRVRYDANYYISAGWVSEDSRSAPEKLTYLFSTAAVWKGAITQGKVTINAIGVPADEVKLNLPKRFVRNGNVWTWQFKDFEPGLADDLIISPYPGRSSWNRPIPTGHPHQDGERDLYATFIQVGKAWSMKHRDFTAAATSALAPGKTADSEILYGAANVADGDPNTCWAEGAKGDGVGESLTLTLRVPRKVSSIEVVNGYCKRDDPALYEQNGRVAEFAVSINGGKPFTASLPDERLIRHTHRIPVPENVGEVKTIQLTIQKVYPGSAYADTCVSDIVLTTPLAKGPKIEPIR